MTAPAAPVSLPPSCSLWIDGVRFADGGTPGEVDTDPVALTDLEVRWGRDNTLDQPEPGTCTFKVLDVTGGKLFTERLYIGAECVVRAEATIYPDPDVPIFTWDESFETGTPPAVVSGGTLTVSTEQAATGTKSARLNPSRAQMMTVVFPPAPFGDDSAWDTVPRATAGQTWRFGASVWLNRAVMARVRPVGFTRPQASTMFRINGADLAADVSATGWQTMTGDVVPPEAVWLGVAVDLVAPRWDDIDPYLTWDSLSSGAVLTNLATNPAPASLTGWFSNDYTKWDTPYANGEISITRKAPADADIAASMYSLADVANPVLPAGVNHQRSVEVWVDAAATTIYQGVGFAGGTALPANQWTRVVEQFTGTGIGQYVMGLEVRIPGVGTGVHVKLRRAQLVANPGGLTLPYFDGSTPDTATTDYAWTGTADASTSNQTTGLGVHVKLRRAQLVANPGGQTVPYFDGSTPDTGTIDYAWTGAANASTSTATSAPALRWDDMGVGFVDDLVLLAPAAGALRRSTVFAGRITDLASSYDQDVGGQVVDVIAQTHLAELNNRYVGDQPWLLEPLATRFSRIVTASGQAVDWQIDSSVQSLPVTWRDVDNAPSGDLLHQLAQSVAGALWSASSDVGRPYLWLEDINQRPSQYMLAKVGGIVVIVPNPATPAHLVVIDACDVLLEPVTWTQTTEDNATRVVVTWQDQTLDDKGNPDPTSRDLTVTNNALELASGRRRIQVTTQLAVQLDAQKTAESILARVSTPGWRLSGITWEMATTDQLDAATLDVVMKLLDGVTKLGIGIRLTNMPGWSPAGAADVNLYLEGGTYTNLDGAWVLDLLTSSAVSQGKSSVPWDSLPGNTAPVATRTNRALNPRAVSTGAAGWLTGRGWGAGGNGAYTFVSQIIGPFADVFTARRKTWSTASTNTIDSGFIFNNSGTAYVPVTAGTVVTASCYVRHSSATAKVFRQRILFHSTAVTGSGTVGGVIEGVDVSIAGGATWTRITLTATVPTGAAGMEVIADVQASPAGNWAVGNTADATCMLVEQAGSALAYFDGATPDVAPIDNAWTGVAHNSTSTATDSTPTTTGWRWDDWSPTMTWNDLHGVGI